MAGQVNLASRPKERIIEGNRICLIRSTRFSETFIILAVIVVFHILLTNKASLRFSRDLSYYRYPIRILRFTRGNLNWRRHRTNFQRSYTDRFLIKGIKRLQIAFLYNYNIQITPLTCLAHAYIKRCCKKSTDYKKNHSGVGECSDSLSA